MNAKILTSLEAVLDEEEAEAEEEAEVEVEVDKVGAKPLCMPTNPMPHSCQSPWPAYLYQLQL